MSTTFELQVAQVYDLRHGNVIQLGGVRLGGFGETAAVSYEYGSDLMEDMVSADGFVTVSNLNDYRMRATLTMMETSKSYAYVAGLMTAQQLAIRAGGAIPLLSYQHTDKLNGDKVSSNQAIFLIRPSQTKERTAGEREFTILLPYAADIGKQAFGVKNLLR